MADRSPEHVAVDRAPRPDPSPRHRRPATIGWRTAAVAGALIGLCGTIQIWGIVPAAVVLILLLFRTARQPGGWLRPVVAYAVAGIAAVILVFLPFVLAAGPGMIRTVIFNQLGRSVG